MRARRDRGFEGAAAAFLFGRAAALSYVHAVVGGGGCGVVGERSKPDIVGLDLMMYHMVV
jgi:hypothetical protein